MQFILTTLGCKVNQYESSSLCAELAGLGYTPAETVEAADIFILNSCAVTESASRKTRQLINSAKKKNPRAITVLSGCYPQAYPEEARKLNPDIIIGTAERKNLPVLIDEFLQRRAVIDRITENPDTYEETGVFNAKTGRTRAFVKIQDGCDCNCAYCIVPSARGNPRSRPLENIKEEAKAAKNAGFREIVLTGINLTKHEDLCGAVSIVAEFAERLRLSSVEPDLLTDDILNRLAKIENLCPHFHLSLQSGSNSVLKRMSRRYTADEYRKKVQKICELFGNREETCAFTTDMMTGFPEETEEEFKESLSFALEMKFAKIHVFPFSPRPGTNAASMENQVPENIKLERRNRLLQTAEEMRREFFCAQVGKTLRVLVEKRTSDDEVFGHSENYTPVKILSKTVQRNEIINIKITQANEKYCTGTEVENAVN